MIQVFGKQLFKLHLVWSVIPVSVSVCLSACPSSPQNLKVVSTSHDAIHITWEVPLDDGGAPIVAFEVECCQLTDGMIDFTRTTRVDAFTRSFQMTSLIEGKSYDFAVRSVNSVGVSQGAATLDKPVVPSVMLGRLHPG